MSQKVNKKIFCIYNLARAGVCESDITQVYISIIRSVLEYACPVWHPGLSKARANEIERVHAETLFKNNLPRMHIHRGASYFWTQHFTIKTRKYQS